jgi:hypothetical protein
MSKRISHEEARRKREHELKSQELNKQGIKPKISRQEKKRRKKMKKTEKFMEMLKFRGGHVDQKTEEEKHTKKHKVKI